MKEKIILLGLFNLLFLSIAYGQNDSILKDKPSPKEELFLVEEKMSFPEIAICKEEVDVDAKNKCFSEELMKSIYKHLNYPEIARRNNIQGTVVVRLSIDQEHAKYCVTLLRDIGAKTGKEAVRATKIALQEMLPHYTLCLWKPTKSRGNPVKSSFHIPIHFRL